MEKIKEDQIVTNVQNSYGRCLGNGDLISTFYDIFLASDPEIKKKFTKTDFDKQKKLLRHGLNLMIMYAAESYAGKAGLKRIQESHNKHNLNIDPKYYMIWRQSLLKAIEKHDRLYNKQVKNEWLTVLDKGIDFIRSGY